VIGHLARAGVLAPAPASPDRAVGHITGGWDSRAAAACQASVQEAERVRWSQYRAVWRYVEGQQCRRRALLSYFGDPSVAASARASAGGSAGACCDVCESPSAQGAADGIAALAPA
jgi:ATP-dependent DNA helicase RecQ